jgi:hypothetical protein
VRLFFFKWFDCSFYETEGVYVCVYKSPHLCFFSQLTIYLQYIFLDSLDDDTCVCFLALIRDMLLTLVPYSLAFYCGRPMQCRRTKPVEIINVLAVDIADTCFGSSLGVEEQLS